MWIQEVKLTKEKLLSKIDALEKERLKLKAFSAEVIENNIESVLASMPLSDAAIRDSSEAADEVSSMALNCMALNCMAWHGIELPA